MFDPQEVPALPRRGPRPPTVFDLSPGEPLPWQEGHEAARRDPGEGRQWHFVVYAGLFDMQKIRAEVERVLGPGTPGEERGSEGSAAVLAFAVGADGHLLEDSAVLSCSAWAVGRLRSPGPAADDWLDGFDSEEKSFVEALNRLSTVSSIGPPHAGPARSGPARSPARAVREHVAGAAVDASNEGAKSLGGVVTGLTAAAITGVAGPVVGGVAGAVAGRFAERLLTITRKNPGGSRQEPAASPQPRPARTPAAAMTLAYLDDLVADLAREFHIDESLQPRGVRVEMRSVRIPRHAGQRVTSTAFLNSFIREDLARVADALNSGDAGPALCGYLTPDGDVDVPGQVDTAREHAAVAAAVEPRARPNGRWPAGREYALTVGQQVAVGRIMADLADRAGISTVNGPPGTGKTTLLRDVVAAVLVRRAERLAAFAAPEAAFAGTVSYDDNGKPRRVNLLHPDLVGSEIVVATNGNKAAENVTEELPLASEDDAARLRRLDYFPDIARELLARRGNGEEQPERRNELEKRVWALTSAALGNFRNRRTFNDVFWWADASEPAPGMKVRLERAVDEAEPARDAWHAAVRSFRTAHHRVQALVAERQQVVDALHRAPRHPERHADLAGKVQAARAGLATSEYRLRDAERECDRARARLAAVDAELAEHETTRPGWWARLVTFGQATRAWQAEQAALDGRRSKAADRESAAAGARGSAATAVEADRVTLSAALRTLRAEEEVAERDARLLDSARERWPEALPVDPSEPDAELVTPWADSEIEIARAALCEEALSLHRAFVFAAARKIRPALIAANKIIGGQRMNRDVARAAWQAFFLVVPVVSTTFASLPRLFADLGREDLGWLLVDEAGQATQQSVVGGLWRARRAVLVGDPMQLEPIVPLPVPAQLALADRYGVDRQWIPEHRSAQVTGDRLTRYGTTVVNPESGESQWVGAPLRVHRRCARPMFDISNDIAYRGSPMVFATPESKPCGLPPSQWIDVTGQETDKVVRAELDQLSRLVSELLRSGCSPEEILVVAPFRAVVAAAKKRLRHQIQEERIGTVHTVQGKEAPVVILVLGGGERGRDWAATRPNLLNVAVSRAKHRLYVIGDRTDWRRRRYFSTAARHLPIGDAR